MALIVLPKQSGQRPGCRSRASSRFDIRCLVIPVNEVPDNVVDLSNNWAFAGVGGTRRMSIGTFGSCLEQVNTDDYFERTLETIAPTTQVTVLAIREKTDTTNRTSALFGVQDTSGGALSRCGAHVPWSDGTVYWDFGGQSGANRLSVASLSFTGVEHWAFTAGRMGLRIYQNGIQRASSATAVTRTADSALAFRIGAGNNTNNADLQRIYFFALLNEEWTHGQVLEWIANPYMLLQPQAPVHRVWMQAAAAAAGAEGGGPRTFAAFVPGFP